MTGVYTKKEAAKILRCSERTIYNLLKNGEIDSTMSGGHKVFLERHIEKYLKKNETVNY